MSSDPPAVLQSKSGAQAGAEACAITHAVVAMPSDADVETNSAGAGKVPGGLRAESGPRFVTVDALRGIAAVGVVLHHLLCTTVMEAPLRRILPSGLQWLCNYGAYGVEIFFVLSGFVIAHSLRNNSLSWASIGNFIVRRQLRLDPLYWTLIVLTLCMLRVEMALPGLVQRQGFRIVEVVPNFFYLQNILGVRQVVGVSWTLCIEVQFYLVFILLLKTGQRARAASGAILPVTVALLFLSGVGSLWFNLWTATVNPRTAWFMQYWFYFAAGVFCYWAFRGKIARAVYFAFAGVLVCGLVPAYHLTSNYRGPFLLTHQSPNALLTAVLTSLTLYGLGRANKLTTWGANPVLQYFGRISYSLYLAHLLFLSAIMRIGYKLTGENSVASLFWFALAFGVSVAVAQALYVCVERPSMRFAARFREKEPKFADGV